MDTQAPALRHVSGYAVLGELGRGGMAVVYLARQPGLDRLVALKELPPIGDAKLGRRFARESRLAGSLSHPNVVSVHDRFEADGTHYIAMEYVPGGSLRPHVGRLTLAQNAAVLQGVLAGLAHAEDHGIVHRDIKPENVMVGADGGVKIADFGIAKATTQLWSGTALTASGSALGTPAYIAPEQALGQPVGPAADLYSVGCMAYELFTGSVPFGGTDQPMALLLRKVREAPPEAAGVDPRIAGWIGALLRTDPGERPQHANEAWQQFEEIVLAIEGPLWRRGARLVSPVDLESGTHTSRVSVPVEPPVAAEPASPGVAAPRSRRLPRIAALVIALGLVIGLVATLTRGPAPGSPPPAPPVTAGELRVEPPQGWSARARTVRIPGLELIDPASLADGHGGIAGVGIAPRSAHRGALLASEFERSLGTKLPAGAEVALRGDLEALRYDGLRPLGLGRSVTVYAVPTSAGVATVACTAPTACRAIAASLRVTGGRTFAVGPSRTLGRAVDGELRRLTLTLRSARPGLPGAGAARTLSAAYRDTFAALEPIAISPADEALQRPLMAALRAAGLGYRDLAAAIRSHDARGYRAAAARAERGEQRVAAAQQRFREQGYRDLVGRRFRAAVIPPPPVPAKPTVTPQATATATATSTPTPTATATATATATPTPTIGIGDCRVEAC